MVRPVGSVAVAVALVLALSACDDQLGENGDVAGASRVVPVVVTEDDRSLPDGCRPAQVARLLNRFFDAFNRGDESAAGFVAFGLAPGGGWYSVSEGSPRRGGRHFVTSTAPELRRYFAARHLHGDHLRLREVIVGYAHGLGQIEYKLSRRADDLRQLGVTTSRVEGKGAVDCERHKIVVWSMGMSDSVAAEHTAPLCPRARTEKTAAVACVRRWRS